MKMVINLSKGQNSSNIGKKNFTNQNIIREVIKVRLKMDSACYHLV